MLSHTRSHSLLCFHFIFFFNLFLSSFTAGGGGGGGGSFFFLNANFFFFIFFFFFKICFFFYEGGGGGGGEWMYLYIHANVFIDTCIQWYTYFPLPLNCSFSLILSPGQWNGNCFKAQIMVKLMDTTKFWIKEKICWQSCALYNYNLRD